MIREDFVSNSSSTSFIIALNTNECSIKKFVHDVCYNCLDEESIDKLHNEKLMDHNVINLAYHLDNTRLLFLGEAYVKDTDRILDIDVVPEYEEKDYWIQQLNELRNHIQKNGKDGILEEYDSKYEIIDDKKIKATYHYYVGYLTENKYDRDSDFSLQYDFIKDDIRIDHIKELLEACYDEKITRKNYHNNIYIIDKDTIALTEIMIKNGINIRFQDGLGLDVFKKYIEEGKTIMYIEVATSGNGWDCDTIYNESEKSSVELFDKLPVIILDSEYM
jgi:hypothetical protein